MTIKLMNTTYFHRLLLIILISATSGVLLAQEYKFEIGGMLGGASYMGDANKTNPFSRLGPAGGAVFRYNINLRWALKSDLLLARVSGSTKGLDNAFPDNYQTDFNRSVVELGEQVEFNFFPYSDKFVYAGTKKITPYILAGIGLSVAPGGGETFSNMNIPLGVGVKYKLRNRLNLGFEFSVRKLLGDGLEGKKELDDPYHIGSSTWKNKDWYSLMLFSLTWEFGLHDCDCNNVHSTP